MGIPIRYCTLVAALEDEGVFRRVAPGMRHNLEHGAFTVLECNHDPTCRSITEDEWMRLQKRFREYEG